MIPDIAPSEENTQQTIYKQEYKSTKPGMSNLAVLDDKVLVGAGWDGRLHLFQCKNSKVLGSVSVLPVVDKPSIILATRANGVLLVGQGDVIIEMRMSLDG
jgi:hypothetical protein